MMNVRFRIGLINASLPSYFPRRHGVFEAAEKMLADLTADLGIGLVSAPDLPMDARAAQQALQQASLHRELRSLQRQLVYPGSTPTITLGGSLGPADAALSYAALANRIHRIRSAPSTAS